MAFCKRIYVNVCVCVCFIAEGSGYFISSKSATWQTGGTHCELAQPNYQYNNGSGVLELEENIQIDDSETIPESGCGMADFSNVTHPVYSLVQCHHICGGTHIGLIEATQMECMCIDILTSWLTTTACKSCGDIICGSGLRKAVYSVFLDTTSKRGTDDIDYVCGVSSSYSNESAWVNCTNTSNTRGVWCRKNAGLPFVSGKSFSAWNAANDYCADNFPASAVGYTGSPFETLTFTNIRREWTMHPGNESSSKGPKQFAYIKPGSKKIFFSNEATAETKQILCYGPKPTFTTPSTTSESSSASTASRFPSKQTTTLVSSMTDASGRFGSSSQKPLQGSSNAPIAAGVSVAVALTIAAGVIVFVLRMKGKCCFAITKGPQYENTDDDHHISLERIESEPNAFYQTLGAPLSDHIYSGLQERCNSADTEVTYQNTNGKEEIAKSEARG